MKINSTNSPKNILRKWQERAQDSERVFFVCHAWFDPRWHTSHTSQDWPRDWLWLTGGWRASTSRTTWPRPGWSCWPPSPQTPTSTWRRWSIFISLRWNGEYLTLLCSGNIFVSFLVQMPGNCRNISDEVFPGIHVGDKWVFTVLLLWSECCQF